MSRQLMFNRRNVNNIEWLLSLVRFYFLFLFLFSLNLLFLDSRLSNSQTFNKIVINSEVYVDSARGSSRSCQIIFSFSSEKLNMKPMPVPILQNEIDSLSSAIESWNLAITLASNTQPPLPIETNLYLCFALCQNEPCQFWRGDNAPVRGENVSLDLRTSQSIRVGTPKSDACLNFFNIFARKVITLHQYKEN